MNTRNTNEQKLTIKIAKQDEKTFLSLFDTYYDKLYLFIQRYVHSAEMAEDLTQEVFIKVWERWDNMADIQSFKAYLYTTAKNHTLNALKKAAQSQATMGEIVHHYYSSSNHTEDEILSKEYLHYLETAIANLPPRSREIFKLCREQKKTYEEVATLMGISKNAVKNHMVLSMKQLRRRLEVDLGIPLSILLGIFL